MITRIGIPRLGQEHLQAAALPPCEDGELLIRRVLTENGSRAYVNGAAVTAGFLREIGEMLIDIHGPHDNQTLLQPSRQLSLLDTYAGLHGTASGGAWMAAVFGFGGVHLSEQGLRITPNLPEKWQSLRFNLVIRGEVLRVTIDRQQVTVEVGNERGLELPARIADNAVTLRSGQTCRVTYRS